MLDKQPSCPAPRVQSLALAHVTVSDKDEVTFSTWTETDFRCVSGRVL